MAFGSRKSQTHFLLAIVLIVAFFVTMACSESERLPDADEAMRNARQAALKVESYSAVMWTGFSEESEGVVVGASEIHRPGIWAQRGSEGVLTSIASGNTAYSLDPGGTWCRREMGSTENQDLLSRVPESLDQVTRVERSENGDLVIEGFAEDFEHMLRVVHRDDGFSISGIPEASDPPADNEYPSLDLHRLVIDSDEGFVVEWKKWRMMVNPEEQLLSKSTDELTALADSRKEGPWDSFKFSKFDQLAPVGIPVLNAQECSRSAESGS